eukprot:11603106-Ditylum_brightwellii.AAC.1
MPRMRNTWKKGFLLKTPMTPRLPQKHTQDNRLQQPQPTTSELLSMITTTTCYHHKTTTTAKSIPENTTKEHNLDINM